MANPGQQLYFAKAGVQSFANTGTIGATGVPTNRVNVTVNAGSTLDFGTSAFTGPGTLTALAGSTLRLGSPAGISAIGTATGNVQCSTRSYGGSLEFNGTGAQVTGTGFPVLLATATLGFNNPVGVTLTQGVVVGGTLSLKQGPVTTADATPLTLGNSTTTVGTLDAAVSNTGTVVGPFRRWVSAATGPWTFPVGTPAQLRPATIDYTTAPTAGGTLTAEFVATAAGNQGLPLTEGSITVNKASANGFWRLAAGDGLDGGAYTPGFTFTGALGIRDYTQLVLLKRANAAADWALVGTHVPTTGSNAAPVLSRTGMTEFSDFTAGGDLAANPLPVVLVSFEAQAQGGAVVLHWRTASEKNSQAFEVERSADGVAFVRIGTVAAAGNSSTAHAYTFSDTELLGLSAPRYYRLRQADADGRFSYSPVRTATAGPADLALFPNPATTGATLTGAQPGARVTVSDALGRPVASAAADAAGTAALVLPAGLAAGVYVVRAGAKALRLTVE